MAILHENQNRAHRLWFRSQPRLLALPEGLYAVGSIHQDQSLLPTLNVLIAGNKTGPQPVNLESGESIVYAQTHPARFHDLLHRPSNGDGFTRR